jgi:hypothetical protein
MRSLPYSSWRRIQTCHAFVAALWCARSWAEHEVVDEQLRSPAEQLD